MVDILIKGGVIVDGTGKKGYEGEIAIKDGKIIAVAPKLFVEAEKVIDAKGKTVIPGKMCIRDRY